MPDYKNSIFEFRMKGRSKDDAGHLWERGIDIREISLETLGDEFERVLLKMDGTNNKTKEQEQIQFHFGRDDFEQLVTGINAIMPEYRRLVYGKSHS